MKENKCPGCNLVLERLNPKEKGRQILGCKEGCKRVYSLNKGTLSNIMHGEDELTIPVYLQLPEGKKTILQEIPNELM